MLRLRSWASSMMSVSYRDSSGIALNVVQQDAVGHHPNERAVADLIVESHAEANRPTDLYAELVGDSFRNGARRHPARLGMANQPVDATTRRDTEFGDLRTLSRSGFAGNDDHLVMLNRLHQLAGPAGDGQRVGVCDRRQSRGRRSPGVAPASSTIIHSAMMADRAPKAIGRSGTLSRCRRTRSLTSWRWHRTTITGSQQMSSNDSMFTPTDWCGVSPGRRLETSRSRAK